MSEFPWAENQILKGMDRVLPHSIEAEQGVLGCIFLSAHECLDDCIDRFKPGPEVFHDLRHQIIYELLVEMYDKKEAIDVISVHQRLKDRNQIDSVGGINYLSSLPDMTPSAANVSVYSNIVLQKYILRRMLSHCTESINTIYGHAGELEPLIHQFESEALAISDSIFKDTTSDVKELVKNRLTFYEECAERGGGLIGISSGYPDLDKMTDGLKAGEMIVLAARPSMGKTSLAINICENVAIDQGIPVGVFSLEMSKESLVGRMVSSRGRVNERSLTRGCADEKEMKNTFTGAMKVGKAPIHIDDTAGLSIGQLRSKARRMVQRLGVKLLVIDYVQLLRTSSRRANRQEEIAEISTGIKNMAKELKVPVIAICQLNRELEKDRERKPRVSDLRESGQIEQDADIIGMLYAANPEEAARNPDVLMVNLLIAKQRNGPTGDVQFTFFKQFTRFESISKIEDRMAPPKSWIPEQEEIWK